MAITVKDIAALAGVSPSTVSRVCNNHPSISKETRERVHKAMAELGYETNPSPSNTQAAHPIRMIGVVLPPSPRKVYENSTQLNILTYLLLEIKMAKLLIVILKMLMVLI